MKNVLFVFSLSLILSGCNFIDEYYVYDKNYLSETENTYGLIKDDELKKDIKEILKSTQLRIKLSSKPKMTLIVIQSLELSDEFRKRLISKKITDLGSESRTYDTCDYVNDRNWICTGYSGYLLGYEMRDGDLYKDGQKLLKKYSINF
ncbi:MAG: hypothetical protein K9J38_01205 [Polynucleobacter sp.]|nr:hypothetical protein [Polynucleobacter sp.]